MPFQYFLQLGIFMNEYNLRTVEGIIYQIDGIRYKTYFNLIYSRVFSMFTD